MDTLSYKTISATKENANKKWILVDAENEILGRLASRVAFLLRGKHKPNYTPHADCGDYVVVINADKVVFSGDKENTKEYIRHTGHPGGQRVATVRELRDKKPFAIVEKAVKGMLPKNKLGSALYKNLYVYSGSEHNQEAQKPQTIDLTAIK